MVNHALAESDSTINYQCTFKEETPPEERPPVYGRIPRQFLTNETTCRVRMAHLPRKHD